MNSPPSLRFPTIQCKRPVWKLSAPLIHALRFVPGSAKGLLFSFAHPAETDFGVGLQPRLVLEERPRSFHHLQDVFEPLALLLALLLGVLLGGDGARPTPAEAQAMERAANGLPAHQSGSPLEQFQGYELAAPARA